MIPFYRNVQSQGISHNVILVPCKDVARTSGILHTGLYESLNTVIDTALITKFRETGVVDKGFTQVHNLLNTTDSVSVFLYHLLVT